MRILHVGFGFRPWIVNGLVIYAEAVMRAQAAAGDEVAYFFCARQLPLVRRPFLHRWRRAGVQMFELVNDSHVVGRHRGSPDPLRDLADPPAELVFRRVLDRFAPDVVHVHDLGGLPSSLLEIARGSGRPVVMSIHDYEPLCPTVKLVDATGRICLRGDPGEMCAVCCADAPTDNAEDLERTVAFVRRRVRAAVPGLDGALRSPAGRWAGDAAIHGVRWLLGIDLAPAGAERQFEAAEAAPGPLALHRPPRAPAAAYQRRREVNVERLRHLDAIIASSQRSVEVLAQLGVSGPPVHLIPVTPPHLERLRPAPRAPADPRAPVHVAALNAAASTQKGADLLIEAVRRLDENGAPSYRLTLLGPIDGAVRDALAAHPRVRLHGPYDPDDLGALLADVDVGLMPSRWEEVYGFAALELLAAGIPVIGNAIGAIPELIRPGETGWLNRSGSAAELAELIAAVAGDRAGIARLRNSVVARRAELIPPLAHQLDRLRTVYETPPR